ncbi:GntR family transcriptional regulator [Alkalicoccus daliensis]|uniref:Transcriptional regulator, GntR family n=1 Tax=Alkalicoccus daliensis TaxID=745820 RepID=A0A1H0HV32_9BACI|nr:GntR family transcriptional regulator [Alkalicoccus daliensis]SDO22964.1 transcriptional regulator, GntR family [Alkalicoccus daliensis]
MSRDFHSKKPIFKQIKEEIEDQILDDRLQEGDKAPSTNELVAFYKVNHLTIAKGVTELVEEEILFKKRGVGMFVSEKAKEKLIAKRRRVFAEEHITEFLREAEKLHISEEELISLIREKKGRLYNDYEN